MVRRISRNDNAAVRTMMPILIVLGISSLSCHFGLAFRPSSLFSSSPSATRYFPPNIDNSIIPPHRRTHTILHAKKKLKKSTNGRKIPKMPSLPARNVVTEKNEEEATASENETGSAEDATSQARMASVAKESSTSSTSASSAASAASSTLVVMDVENIRGATSFRISHEALLSRIRMWRDDRLNIARNAFLSRQSSSSDGGSEGTTFLEPLLWVCDHGMTSSIHHFSLFPNSEYNDGGLGGDSEMPHNFGVIFAGPGRSADDVIVDTLELRCSGSVSSDSDVATADESTQQRTSAIAPVAARNTTIVITADAKLISRCQQARRKSSSLSDVIFVEPASLLQQLEKYRTSSNEEESFFGAGSSKYIARGTSSSLVPKPSITSSRKTDGIGRNKDGTTSTMTSFRESSIASEQHAKFQARFQNKKMKGEGKPDGEHNQRVELSDDAEATAEEENEEENSSVNEEQNNDSRESNADTVAAQLRTEEIRRRLLRSDAYYLARPNKNVRGRRAHTTMAAVHAKYKNRNISKKQQKKLFAKRFGNKRKEDMIEAANTRKELAGTLQVNLVNWEQNAKSNGTRSIKGGEFLLETLLGWFETEKELANEGVVNSVSHLDGQNGDTASVTPSGDDIDPTEAASILGWGTVGSNNKWDPLGSIIRVPLEKSENEDGQSATSSQVDLPPLRVVVISDTHGFEGALARFPPPGTDEDVHVPEFHHHDSFLLPRADVLIHCGDFAASGSRKSQRQAARRLDDFLARQTHIPEKIVVQGNHDPETPAKTLFPNSKALYVRTPSTLMVNGVSFALEPYSRRMAFRSSGRRMATSSFSRAASSFPKCDVLVSHEPPRGLLDLTYHGFSAGSAYLRDIVECASDKPRLWLCGHIHEGRGVMKHRFVSGDEQACDSSSTLVINAANANTGRANRLVTGAVVVDVDRNPLISNGNNSETAESTLRVRTIDDPHEFLDQTVGSNNLSLHGMEGMEELEIYQTRPGVRRRKGVPQSVRQHKLQQARSAAVSSGDN